MNNSCETAFGTFIINRNSEETNLSLQGWNRADLYILNTLSEQELDEDNPLLVLNDSFGALTVPLSRKFPILFQNDSFCSKKACKKNLLSNGLVHIPVQYLNPGEVPPCDVSGILLKIPKSLNYLEYQLQYIASEFPRGIPVIAADMAKNIRSSTVSLFEHYLKGVKTSLAWKKSRLVRGRTGGPAPVKSSFPVSYKPLDEPFEVVNYPNLFAYGRLDPGSAFILSNFPAAGHKRRVIDLACGDGVLALKAAFLWPEAEFLCIDESYLAVKSAEESFRRNGLRDRGEFRVGDSLEGVEEDSADVILCNPPFHSSHSLSTATALKMFRESRLVLKRGGELFVIANRHLAYEKQLSHLFGRAQIVNSNRKFSLIRAVR